MNASEREGECVLAMYSKCVFRRKRLLMVQEVVYSTWHWIMDDMQMSTPDSWRFKGTKGFLKFWWHSTNWGRCCFLSIQSNTITQREQVTDKWLIKNYRGKWKTNHLPPGKGGLLICWVTVLIHLVPQQISPLSTEATPNKHVNLFTDQIKWPFTFDCTNNNCIRHICKNTITHCREISALH